MSFFGRIWLSFGFKKVICCLYHSGTVGILRIIIKGEWWDTPIPWSPTFRPQKKIISQDKQIIEIDISQETRKPLSQLTSKGLRTRLSPLLNLIEVLAEKEETDLI